MTARAIMLGDRLDACAVVGQHDPPTGVRHVGLVPADRTEVRPGNRVAAFEMTLTHLRIQEGRGGQGQGPAMIAHVAGWVEDLHPAKLLGMKIWLRKLVTRRPPRVSYIIHPPARPHPAYPEAGGEPRRAAQAREEVRSFSCAGLIESCYDEGAELRLIDHAALPEVPAAVLSRIWPEVEHLDPERLRALGLAAGQAQRLLLPGYLLHSLARRDPHPPYAPQPGDWCFPHGP